jgi:hypothetical protein
MLCLIEGYPGIFGLLFSNFDSEIVRIESTTESPPLDEFEKRAFWMVTERVSTKWTIDPLHPHTSEVSSFEAKEKEEDVGVKAANELSRRVIGSMEEIERIEPCSTGDEQLTSEEEVMEIGEVASVLCDVSTIGPSSDVMFERDREITVMEEEASKGFRVIGERENEIPERVSIEMRSVPL